MNEERLAHSTNKPHEHEELTSFNPIFSSSFSLCNSSAITSKSTSPGQSVKDQSIDNSEDEDDTSRRNRGNKFSTYVLKKCLIVDGKYHYFIYFVDYIILYYIVL